MPVDDWICGDVWHQSKVKQFSSKGKIPFKIEIWEKKHWTGTPVEYAAYVEYDGVQVCIVEKMPTMEEATFFAENNIKRIEAACDHIRYGIDVLTYMNPEFIKQLKQAEEKKKKKGTPTGGTKLS
jgi:hypothetical protein